MPSENDKHEPVWLYHKDEAPAGRVFDNATHGDINAKLKQGWVKSPAEFNGAASKPKNLDGEAKAPHLGLDWDAMSDDEIITKIDDLGRSDIEQLLTERGRPSPSRETRTSNLRHDLVSTVRPGLTIGRVQAGADEEFEAPDNDSIDHMQVEARNNFIDAMPADEVKAELRRRDVKFAPNAGEDRVRAALKALFTD